MIDGFSLNLLYIFFGGKSGEFYFSAFKGVKKKFDRAVKMMVGSGLRV